MTAIAVRDLTKSYGARPAVRGVTFAIAAGEIFALLGPNGAGKTTTIEILEGYRRRDGGEVSVLGLDPGRQSHAVKARIGIVLQTTALEPELTVAETLAAFARLYPKSRPADQVLADVDLSDLAGRRVGTLSGGQKRRLEIALGIVGAPDVLFLDEPTTGLDPDARRKIWRLIRRLNGAGTTIVLSSHYMDEVEALAGRMAIMVAGRIVAVGAPAELQRRYCGEARIRFDCRGGLPAGFPPALIGAVRLDNGHAELRAADPAPTLAELTGWALAHDFDLSSLTVARTSLEDIYLELTGEAREAAP